ncbi:hypothetical protein AHAS_AhasUnG0041000 [Arachis hypogaea]
MVSEYRRCCSSRKRFKKRCINIALNPSWQRRPPGNPFNCPPSIHRSYRWYFCGICKFCFHLFDKYY